MSTSRLEALRHLVRLDVPLEQARAELKTYPWDIPEALLSLDASDIVSILARFLQGDLTAEDVEQWADALETREDVECRDDQVKETLFELANPDLTEPLTRDRAIRLVAVLTQ